MAAVGLCYPSQAQGRLPESSATAPARPWWDVPRRKRRLWFEKTPTFGDGVAGRWEAGMDGRPIERTTKASRLRAPEIEDDPQSTSTRELVTATWPPGPRRFHRTKRRFVGSPGGMIDTGLCPSAMTSKSAAVSAPKAGLSTSLFHRVS
jgi:hypothetical protein